MSTDLSIAVVSITINVVLILWIVSQKTRQILVDKKETNPSIRFGRNTVDDVLVESVFEQGSILELSTFLDRLEKTEDGFRLFCSFRPTAELKYSFEGQSGLHNVVFNRKGHM